MDKYMADDFMGENNQDEDGEGDGDDIGADLKGIPEKEENGGVIEYVPGSDE